MATFLHGPGRIIHQSGSKFITKAKFYGHVRLEGEDEAFSVEAASESTASFAGGGGLGGGGWAAFVPVDNGTLLGGWVLGTNALSRVGGV